MLLYPDTLFIFVPSGSSQHHATDGLVLFAASLTDGVEIEVLSGRQVEHGGTGTTCLH